MMEISKQLLELATKTAERMLQDGELIAPIETTGFNLISDEKEFTGYTPLSSIEVKGKRFVIAWEKSLVMQQGDMGTVNNEEQSTDPNCNADKEVPMMSERLLNSGFRLPEREYPFFGHNPIAPLHLEFERLAREALRKEGIVRTKNNTILRIIK
jgi:hypothetical protein